MLNCKISVWQKISAQGGEVPICSRCKGFKPARAHHCSQCDRCIMKMDHHCPWVNNCVGVNNQKHFCLFCLYIACISTYALMLLFFRAIGDHGVHRGNQPQNMGDLQRAARQTNDPGGRLLMMTLLFFEAILFGLFTLAMLSEQLSGILRDQTGIERLKQQEPSAGRTHSAMHLLSHTFGRPISLLWLLPTTVKYNGLTWIDLMPAECDV